MNILIVSDTHGNKRAMREAIFRQGPFDCLIHLGDGVKDSYLLYLLLKYRRSFPNRAISLLSVKNISRTYCLLSCILYKLGRKCCMAYWSISCVSLLMFLMSKSNKSAIILKLSF